MGAGNATSPHISFLGQLRLALSFSASSPGTTVLPGYQYKKGAPCGEVADFNRTTMNEVAAQRGKITGVGEVIPAKKEPEQKEQRKEDDHRSRDRD